MVLIHLVGVVAHLRRRCQRKVHSMKFEVFRAAKLFISSVQPVEQSKDAVVDVCSAKKNFKN